jgi:flagellar hook-associated protein 3 FlgL
MRISTAQYQRVSVGNVLEQQAKLAKLQQQLSSGRRILTPADDPAGAAQALQFADKISSLERLQQNANIAANRLAQEDTSLEQTSNLIRRVRELSLDANNGSKTAADRRLIAAELRERFNELVQIGNGEDGNGEYLFAGTASRELPFVVVSGREIEYRGDQAERFVQVGPTRQLPVNHSGYDLFMRIPQGNGVFVTAANPGNTGSGVIDNGLVTDPSLLTGHDYQVRFTTNAAGELAYLVEDVTAGAIVLPAPPAVVPDDAPVYSSGEPIDFDGMSITISGTPEPGDEFNVLPATPQSLFATLDRLISVLEDAKDTPANRAQIHSTIGGVLANLDNASENILRIRAEVGSRLHAIDAEVAGNEDSTLAFKTAMSQIADLDYASAISEFQLQLVGLQAAQQSYVRLQGMSLLNFI